MEEEWRDVVGEGHRYEVSSLGRIRTKPKILKPWDVAGYKYVSLGRGVKKAVHRLVCEAFHGPAKQPKMVVAHSDGSRDNNTPINLRWATYSENLSDSVGHGTCRLPQYADPRRGERHGMAKLSNSDVEAIRSECQDGKARKSVADHYGISTTHLRRIIRGENW